mgnify:CR=1 FL=1
MLFRSMFMLSDVYAVYQKLRAAFPGRPELICMTENQFFAAFFLAATVESYMIGVPIMIDA